MNFILVNIKLKLAKILKQDDTAFYYLPLLAILRVLSWLYRVLILSRNFFYDREILASREVDIPVVSIGNITLGGTGKTPTTAVLAEMLKNSGYHPAVVCRGYGQGQSDPAVVTEGSKMLLSAEEAGDEAYLLARELEEIPVVVCSNKTRAAEWVDKNCNSDIMIIDDGFQHRSLQRDFDLVLLDATFPLGNGYLLPRGFLREPPRALKRADGVVITRIEQTDTEKLFNLLNKVDEFIGELPVFFGSYQPCSLLDFQQNEYPLDFLRGKKIKAFSGIGNPESFSNTLKKLQGKLDEHIVFPDHYEYSRDNLAPSIDFNPHFSGKTDAEIYKNSAEEPQIIVTTSKDFVRLDQDLAEFFRARGYKLLMLKMSMQIISADRMGEVDSETFPVCGEENAEIIREKVSGERNNIVETIVDTVESR